MIYGAYCKPLGAFASFDPAIYSNASVLLDFIAGVYRVNGTQKALAEMLSEVPTVESDGIYVGYRDAPYFTETQPPFLIDEALSQALSTMQGQFTVLFEFKDTVGENLDSVAFGASADTTGTNNEDDFWFAVGGTSAFCYDLINEIPAIGNNREVGGTVTEGSIKRMVVSRSPTRLVAYINGTQVDEDNQSTINLQGLHSVCIGGPAWGGGYDYGGFVRRAIIYPIKDESLLAALSSV